MDTVTKAVRSRIMSKIKSKNTLPERLLFEALQRKGIKFRKHADDLPGKPDVVFDESKIAIFVDGCFFHGCVAHCKLPKSNVKFWKNKIQTNMLRDVAVNAQLKLLGWRVCRAWECSIKKLYG